MAEGTRLLIWMRKHIVGSNPTAPTMEIAIPIEQIDEVDPVGSILSTIVSSIAWGGIAPIGEFEFYYENRRRSLIVSFYPLKE